MSSASKSSTPYDVCGKGGPATTNPACAHRDSMASKSDGCEVRPWLNRIRGYEPGAGVASPAGAGADCTEPSAGYQMRVGSGRSAPREKVRSRRPTAKDRAGATPGCGTTWVTLCGMSDEPAVDARIGAVEDETAVGARFAQAETAPVARRLNSRVRLRMVIILPRFPVLTMRI